MKIYAKLLTCPICDEEIEFIPACVTFRSASPPKIFCKKCDMIMYGDLIVPPWHNGELTPEEVKNSNTDSDKAIILKWNNRIKKEQNESCNMFQGD